MGMDSGDIIMTVDELIENLLRVKNRKRKVILSIDPEGNGFSPVGNIEEYIMVDNEDLKLESLTKRQIKMGFTENDVADPNEPGNEEVLVLWPE